MLNCPLAPTRPWRHHVAAAVALTVASLWPSAGMAAPLAVALRGSAALPATAVDQHGATFTVTGLSGITHRGGSLFAAVMDNSNRLVQLDVRLAADGTIASAAYTGGLTLDQSRDFEGIAYTNVRRGTVWLADEGDPELGEYGLKTGALRQTLAAPAVFAQQRGGFGWESLARRAGGGDLWTANEEALIGDGGVSSPTQGTVVRLVRFAARGESFAPAEQYAYRVEPWHAGDSTATTGERSGLVDLVALADGTLLVLERSLAFSGPIPSFQNRLYQLDFAGATDVTALAGLAGQTYVPVTKHLLWFGEAAGQLGMNLEGISLGPRLANGHATLIGIVDDGGARDPLSTNTVVAFEITSPIALPGVPGDTNFDGKVDRADAAVLARNYGAAEGAVWEDGDFGGDGVVSLADMVTLAVHFTPAPAAEIEPTEPKNSAEIAAPDPSAGLLAFFALGGAGLFALARRRRKRRLLARH